MTSLSVFLHVCCKVCISKVGRMQLVSPENLFWHHRFNAFLPLKTLILSVPLSCTPSRRLRLKFMTSEVCLTVQNLSPISRSDSSHPPRNVWYSFSFLFFCLSFSPFLHSRIKITFPFYSFFLCLFTIIKSYKNSHMVVPKPSVLLETLWCLPGDWCKHMEESRNGTKDIGFCKYEPIEN